MKSIDAIEIAGLDIRAARIALGTRAIASGGVMSSRPAGLVTERAAA